MILIETIDTGLLLVLLTVMATIIFILSVAFIVDDDWEEAPSLIVIFVILVILIIAVCVVDKTSYKIKIIDDNVTVKELTDTFIIEHYDAKNDIWTVQQKDGGLNPADLDKKGE